MTAQVKRDRSPSVRRQVLGCPSPRVSRLTFAMQKEDGRRVLCTSHVANQIHSAIALVTHPSQTHSGKFRIRVNPRKVLVGVELATGRNEADLSPSETWTDTTGNALGGPNEAPVPSDIVQHVPGRMVRSWKFVVLLLGHPLARYCLLTDPVGLVVQGCTVNLVTLRVATCRTFGLVVGPRDE